MAGRRVARPLNHADETGAWNALRDHFEMRRINHEEAYSAAGARTNNAESYFPRLRRAEIGHHHHFAGSVMARGSPLHVEWRTGGANCGRCDEEEING